VSIVSFIPKALRKDKPPVPTISLCQTTARLPDGWRAAAQAWHDAADNPGDIEHVIVTDDPAFKAEPIFANTKIGLNRGRKCAVDGWNKSAELSTGRFLITLADDWFPCPHWDTEFLKLIPDLDGEYVLEVDTGGNPGLLTFSLLTRKYYERYGYLFWPQYLGMYADNEFTIVARRDGVVIDAKHLFCEHRHPLYGFGEMDETHKHQHRREAFEVGEEVYRRRLLHLGFAHQYVPPRSYSIAVCMPGESFKPDWVANTLKLTNYIAAEASVFPMPGYAPNPHIVRQGMSNEIQKVEPMPDLVLWIDHDNLVAPIHFARLYGVLKEHPEIDGVAGWCYWGQEEGPLNISCGVYGDGRRHYFSEAELINGPELREIDFTGFPCFLMRGETLKKAGKNAFAPISDETFPYGFVPEDLAFCRRAKEAGCRFMVDRTVYVPHRKVQTLEPKEGNKKLSVA
jgi:hypothetical protein